MESKNNIKIYKMTNEIIWDSVPSQRTVKKEQFTTAVVTMSALAGKGAGRKFTFNKASQELLEIQGEDRVSFGFSPDGCHIYLKKVTGDAGFQLTKTCSFSDKKTFEFISKRLELNNDEENHFDILPTELGSTVFELALRTPMTAMVENFADAKEVVEFKTMDLGTVTDEDPYTPYEEAVSIASIIDEDIEETAETADLSAHLTSEDDETIEDLMETEEDEDVWS